MKFIFYLFVLFTQAAIAGVSIEIGEKSFDCQKRNTSLFLCEDGDSKILVFKNLIGYTAVEKKGAAIPELKLVTKVTKDEKILFEIPRINSGRITEANPIKTKAEKLKNASLLITTLNEIDDSLAKDFLSEAKAFVYKEKAAKNKVQIISGNNKFNCVRGDDRPLSAEQKKSEEISNTPIQCNFYACKGPEGKKVLGHVPNPGAKEVPYLIVQKGERSEVKFDDLKVMDPNDEKGAPLFAVPSESAKGEENWIIDPNLFYPKKFEKNKSAFDFYTDPSFSSNREASYNQCGGNNEVAKLIEEDKKIAETFTNELLKMDLGHYLTLVSGQILSFYIDATKAARLGCHYGDMIVSEEAAKHLAWLNNANKKPDEKYLNEKEVQELFLKAKNMSDIPFGYKKDGCYARAHVMARRFEAMGIPTQKVWIKGSLYVPGTDISWNYHVAPVVLVKTQNGEVKKYAIDPSLNDKAVTVDDWVLSMGKKVKGGVVQTLYPFPGNVVGYHRTAVAFSSSDIYVPDNDEEKTEEQNMELAIETMREYTEALKGN